MEECVRLLEYPNYDITPSGRVISLRYDRDVAQSKNQQGHVKVSLYDSYAGKQVTRSVALLVAKTFLPGSNDIFNTPMHLNGDITDCHVENLVWRPRWYAYEYHRQFTVDRPHTLDRYGHLGQIVEVNDNTLFETASQAMMALGVRIRDIFKSAHSDSAPAYPLNYRFVWMGQ